MFYGWVVLALCTLAKVFKVQGQNNLMAYSVPFLLEEYGLSHGEMGTLFSVGTLAASTVQPRFGSLVDRYGARVCLPLAQLAFAAALLAFAASRRLQRGALYAEVVAIFFCLRSRKTAGRLGWNQLSCASTELNTRNIGNI